MSNLNLPICNFWPLPLALSSGTTEKDLSLPGKEALLILPAGFLLYLSALSEHLARQKIPGSRDSLQTMVFNGCH